MRPKKLKSLETKESKLNDFSWLCFADILGGNFFSSDENMNIRFFFKYPCMILFGKSSGA